MSNEKLSPQQRATLFASATRQYKQTLGAMKFREGNTVSQALPKARFLSKILLQVKGDFTLKHANKVKYDPSVFDKYNLLKQVRLSMNNGFIPYQLSGAMLYTYNQINQFTKVVKDDFKTNICDNVVSTVGAKNKVNFIVELPITINDRDPIGLLLLQNEQTLVELAIDCSDIKSIMKDTDIEVVESNISITPILETFSIPTREEFVPDYSVIKVVNQQVESFGNAGEMVVKLPVGLTYRKLFVYVAKDNKFTPLEHEKVGRFQLAFNQADTPYNLDADIIAYENTKDYAGSLPLGTYCIDFSKQGIANMGGGRDYVDTERLTEFWLKMNFKDLDTSNNYVYIVAEKLSRLV